MNQGWSELNKTMQIQLKKESCFSEGIASLLTLRQTLMDELLSMKSELSPEDFCTMPFPNAKGYHCKTIAYSIWHIFRIEDIVVHDLILQDDEILWAHRESIGASIVTTGNELAGQQIVDFSQMLNIDALYTYALAVKNSTDEWLRRLSYKELSRKFSETDQTRLQTLKVVSTDESACWLLDFWCGKNVRGLIQMPLSRHWIMHIEASIRIREKLKFLKSKGTKNVS